jgi:hypothetical protein
VTGAIVVALALLVGVVEDGVVVSDVDGELGAALVEPCALDAGLALDALAGAGVGCGVAAGGWALAGALAALATSDGSSGASWPTAKEALGAGPIAAPTATPTASIAAARAAVTRGDGARKGLVWLSGVLSTGMLFIELGEIIGKPQHRLTQRV